MAEEFFIPKLGQTVEEVTLLQWLAEDGAKVEHGQEILEVETDKAAFMVEANASGFLHRGPYSEDTVVPVLEVVAIIGGPDDKFELPGKATTVEEPVEAEPSLVAESASAVAVAPAETTFQEDGKIFASPRARKLAQVKGVDLSLLTPTGGGGQRIVERRRWGIA